jgi:acetyltransferase-like isoleucine patch superfamily enzyme
MRRIINYLVVKLKGYNHYYIDESISNTSILIEIFNMAIKSLYYNGILSIRLRSFKVRFVGKKISVRCAKRISIGSGGRIGNYVKIDGLSKRGVIIGNATNIDDYSIIQTTSVLNDIGLGLKIGRNCGIGSFSFLGCQGYIEIGNDVIIGPGLKIFTENHNFEDVSQAIRNQGTTRASVVIEDNVWIGANVTILSGVKIFSGSVIAAGSVLSRSFSGPSLIAGVPGKKIKDFGDKS